MARMEGLIEGTRVCSFAFGNPSLRRYAEAQLGALRRALARAEEEARGGPVA
jgi:hypothetical protein